jgi:hypothetical protein
MVNLLMDNPLKHILLIIKESNYAMMFAVWLFVALKRAVWGKL